MIEVRINKLKRQTAHFHNPAHMMVRADISPESISKEHLVFIEYGVPAPSKAEPSGIEWQ